MESNKKSNFLLELKYCFKSSTRIYFVSEYIEGGSIYNRVESGRLYNEESLKFIAAQIVLALNELHRKQILHRDLKPENVLIRENGYIMLTGYGRAKIMIHPNLTKTIC
jgi:serine/threonine protein kinase